MSGIADYKGQGPAPSDQKGPAPSAPPRPVQRPVAPAAPPVTAGPANPFNQFWNGPQQHPSAPSRNGARVPVGHGHQQKKT